MCMGAMSVGSDFRFVRWHACVSRMEILWGSGCVRSGYWTERLCVFCSFNALYTVDPVVFRLWMNVVKSMRGSAVLWSPMDLRKGVM